MSGRGHRDTTGQKEKYPIVTSYDEQYNPGNVGVVSFRNSNVKLITTNILSASGIASGAIEVTGAGGNVTLPGTQALLQALSQASSDVVPVSVTTASTIPALLPATTQRLLITFFLYNNSAATITLLPGDGNTTITPSVTVPAGQWVQVGIEPTQLANGGSQPGQVTVYPVAGPGLAASMVAAGTRRPNAVWQNNNELWYVNGNTWTQQLASGITTQYITPGANTAYTIDVISQDLEAQYQGAASPVVRQTQLTSVTLCYAVETNALTGASTASMNVYAPQTTPVEPIGTAVPSTIVQTPAGLAVGYYTLTVTPTAASFLNTGNAINVYTASFVINVANGGTLRIYGAVLNYTKAYDY